MDFNVFTDCPFSYSNSINYDFCPVDCAYSKNCSHYNPPTACQYPTCQIYGGCPFDCPNRCTCPDYDGD